MKFRQNLKQSVQLIVLGVIALGAIAAQPRHTDRAAAAAMTAPDFVPIASKGFYFGEGTAVEQDRRQNSYNWSMEWWRGKLYVGTGRATQCVQMATLIKFYPDYVSYPPYDPTVSCTEDPRDLPLQAEIWRWTPETNVWDRIFQSPQDVPIPGYPGKFVARDIGFRDMLVFTEADGTEALYVSGVSSRSFNSQLWPFNPDMPAPDPGSPPAPDMPAPRLLRSTDGVNFEPVPLDSDTFATAIGFRSLVSYKGRLYAIASEGYLGQGPVYAADDPARGNFKMVTNPNDKLTFYELLPYNGFLYLGGGRPGVPFVLWKTDGSGSLPHTLSPVVTNGGWSPDSPGYPNKASQSIVSMHVFKDKLYVGTDRPAEILRVNPDDTWDLVVGTPRETPAGWKEPLSGMDAGFDWQLNYHIWRMQTHDDVLYVSTFDQSTHWEPQPVLSRLLREKMGFDLYSSEDGVSFTMVTQTGFGNKYDVGGRNFASTPCGLFLGGVNVSYGATLWRAGDQTCRWPVHLPLLAGQGDSKANRGASPAAHPEPEAGPIQPPQALQGEIKDGKVVLSWVPPVGAARFRVFRAEFTLDQRLAQELAAQDSQLAVINDQLVEVSDDLIAAADTLGIADVERDVWLPGAYAEIGKTSKTIFVDGSIASNRFYHYYVVAEDRAGADSGPSTLVRLPNLAATVDFTGLENTLSEWSAGNRGIAPAAAGTLLEAAARAKQRIEAGDLEGALRELGSLEQAVMDQPELIKKGRTEDLRMVLAKLRRRIELVRLGILAPTDLAPAR